ncbi:MAG TPA: hypothetical protein VN944_07495 [Nitrospiria bacterium]|nr:hypothetical protein [Nitrospiria bacterium]
MFDALEGMLPEHWRPVFRVVMAPIAWIFAFQKLVVQFFMESDSGEVALAKFVFLFFPALLLVGAVWSTQLSIYTVPFRSYRIRFFSLMLLSWWDGARSVWLYWTGVVRFSMVAVGWFFSIGRLFLKLFGEFVRHLIMLPFSVGGKMTQNYFRPGVPWIAFIMLLFWCLLESTIFTYTLMPTITEVLGDMVGMDASRSVIGPFLFLFLFMLIMGSFACVYALMEAMRKKEIKFIIQIVLVEVFVMFFEVMFLYRELVDAITPWIAQQTGEHFRMGIGMTISLATFGWIGIRGMTWFLFGQFGTPPLMAFISRKPLATEGAPVPAPVEELISWWKKPLEDLKQELTFLHAKGIEFLEYLALPALNVLGALLNFSLVLVAARPIFSLPFKSLKEVMDTREILAELQIPDRPLEPRLETRKVES